MVNLRKEYLCSYDIEDTKTRNLLYKELAQYGMTAVQKSVFWGYLSLAELNSIERFLKNIIKNKDKAFITKTNFNGRGQSFFIGHNKNEFKDWDTYDCI